MKNKNLDNIANKLVNAFLKNKIIAAIPSRYTKKLPEAQSLRKLCESKIFKPIANLQPFIIIGSPQTLKTLKQLGFETFSDFWDESYDEETDPLKRIEKIYKLLEYLNNLSMDEIHNIYQKSIPILKHNQQKLFNYRHHHLMDVSFFKYFEGLLVGRTLQKHLN